MELCKVNTDERQQQQLKANWFHREISDTLPPIIYTPELPPIIYTLVRCTLTMMHFGRCTHTQSIIFQIRPFLPCQFLAPHRLGISRWRQPVLFFALFSSGSGSLFSSSHCSPPFPPYLTLLLRTIADWPDICHQHFGHVSFTITFPKDFAFHKRLK